MTSDQNFNLIIEEYKNVIYKVCHSYSDNQEDFEDYYQEICYQIWKSLDSFQRKSKLSTWIYRIALNVCFMQLKKKKKKINTVVNEGYDLIDEFDTEQEENLQLLYKAIRCLESTERALMILYLEDKSYKEMADILGITVTNIGARVNRTKKKLKTIMIAKLN